MKMAIEHEIKLRQLTNDKRKLDDELEGLKRLRSRQIIDGDPFDKADRIRELAAEIDALVDAIALLEAHVEHDRTRDYREGEAQRIENDLNVFVTSRAGMIHKLGALQPVIQEVKTLLDGIFSDAAAMNTTGVRMGADTHNNIPELQPNNLRHRLLARIAIYLDKHIEDLGKFRQAAVDQERELPSWGDEERRTFETNFEHVLGRVRQKIADLRAPLAALDE
jgi:hypothetical protein